MTLRRAKKWGAAALVLLAFAVVVGCLSARGSWRTGERHGDESEMCALFDHSHATFGALLARFVDDGVVDYTGILSGGRDALENTITELEGVCSGAYDAWTDAQRIAYWVNAYNAYTLRLVVDHMPVASIQDIGIVQHTVWFKTVTRATALHEALSLDQIEHAILRKDFVEPRIHFAIVCASQSCPKLASGAYSAETLDAQLDEAARAFVRDETKNRYDAVTHTLYLSSIFSWFEGDFTRGGKTLVDFVAPYLDDETRAAVTARAPSVVFLDYDWSLNGR